MEMFIFTLFLGFWEIHAQSAGNSQHSTGITSFQQLDRTVVDSVLKIVDDKFDSLSERITSLERAVNGLQYYNVRQFKIVNTNLNSVDRTVQGMNSQIGLIGVENKGLKISIDSVKRDVKSMEKVNNMMFDAMEQNFNYLNKGFSEKLENLQGMVSVINQSSDEISQKMKDTFSNFSPTTEQNCSSLFEKFEEKIDLVINSSLTSHLENSEERRRSSGELKVLTHTLSSLNNNLKNSISYYHHTGGLVERIVGATETVAEDQTMIRDDLREFLEKQTNITNCHNTKKPTYIPNKLSDIPPGKSERLSKCEIPINAISEFKQVLKNGSQLVELVTDLAQTSQISLKTTVVELLKEVHRMKETKKATPYRNHQNVPITNGFIEYDFEMLLNATKGVLQMAEAIASHTRWIPYIFHNLQFVEGQINHTLSNSRNMQLMLNQFERNSSDLDTMKLDNISSAIGFIYQTSMKLHRLTPSLTKLLGEPEPFIVLNGGSSETEGRVEIYKKGRWGTLCGRFSNIEAAYICRHLGYMGGVSAGHGYFGPGSGMFWRINVSCLYTRQCDIVKPVINAAQCDHQQDFGVICDHMVRLRAADDESTSRNTGFLEYHYMEEWIRICSDNWSPENTRVACQQLGFEDGIVSEPTKKYVHQIDVPAILNGVNCTGNEERLDSCAHSGWSPNNCNSKQIVHLTCS